jgi:hypothetical protein
VIPPPDASAAFVANMAAGSAASLVCLDETLKQLIIETRAQIPAKPGRKEQANGSAHAGRDRANRDVSVRLLGTLNCGGPVRRDDHACSNTLPETDSAYLAGRIMRNLPENIPEMIQRPSISVPSLLKMPSYPTIQVGRRIATSTWRSELFVAIHIRERPIAFYTIYIS